MKLKLLLKLFLLSSLLGTTLQAGAQNVTFSYPVASLADIVKALGEQIKQPLAVSGAIDYEVLYVNVTDVPLGELLDRIAKTVKGEWATVDGKTMLIRSKAAEKLQKEYEREARVKLITSALDALRKVAQKPLDLDLAKKSILKERELNARTESEAGSEAQFEGLWRQQEELRALSPASRSLARLILALPLADLVSIKRGERVVYATDPTPMQRPLPGATSKVIADLLAETKIWKAAASIVPPEAKPAGGHEGDEPDVLDGIDGSSPLARAGNALSKPPAKAIMVFENIPDSMGLTVSFALFDEAGQRVLSARNSLDWTSSHEDEQSTSLGNATTAAPDARSPKIQLTGDAKQIADLLFGPRASAAVGLSSSEAPKGLEPSLRQKLLAPDRFEPLSYAATDIMRQLSEYKKLNVVVRVDDGMLDMILWLFRPDRTLYECEQMVTPKGGLDKSGGWLFGDLADSPMLEGRISQRTSRSSLARYLRGVEAAGRPTLDLRARFAFENAASEIWVLERVLMRLLFPGTVNQMGGSDQLTLRFFGSFNQQQRAELEQGGRLTAMSLMPVQKALLNEITFGATEEFEDRLVYQDPEKPPIPEASIEAGDDVKIGESHATSDNQLMTEPTQALPRGVPIDAIISMVVKKGPVLAGVVPSGDRARFGGAYQSIESLAWQLAAQERPDLFPWVQDGPKFDKFNVGINTTYSITIEYRKGLFHEQTLKDFAPVSKSPVTLDNLPPEILAQLKKEIDKQKESFKNMKPGQYDDEYDGGESPPPPGRR